MAPFTPRFRLKAPFSLQYSREVMSESSEESVVSCRDSTDSSQSQGSRYTSRFHEHMSQAYSTYPPEWPFPTEDTQAEKGHKHNPSVNSVVSISSNGSSKSVSDKLRKFAVKMKSSVSRTKLKSTAYENPEYVIKGSTKTFRKEDIKLGGLTNSSNMLHYI